MKGYGGRLLFVDCATGATRIEPLAERTARALLGGNGLAARVLYDHVAGRHRRLRSRQCRRLRGRARHRHDRARQQPGVRGDQVAAHRSLLRLHLRRSLPGHAQAHRLRRRRRSPAARRRRPTCSVDEHGGAAEAGRRICGGSSTREAVNALLEVEGADADAIAIGPAGEQRVRFAAMAHYWKNREGVSGRGGIGAVLGSKNVKARGRAGHAQDRDRRSGCAQGAARGDARAAASTGTKALSDLRHAVPRRPDQRAGRARQLQPQERGLRRGAARSAASR